MVTSIVLTQEEYNRAKLACTGFCSSMERAKKATGHRTVSLTN